MKVRATSWMKSTRNAENSMGRVTAEMFPVCRDGSKFAVIVLERNGRDGPEYLRIEFDFEATVGLECDAHKITRCE